MELTARLQRLNEARLTELFDPPTEQRELVRRYTLSETDLTAINRGAAVITTASATPSCAATCDIPVALCALVSGRQPLCWHLLLNRLDVLPASIDTY